MDPLSQLYAVINAGVNLVDEAQEVVFVKYVRQILPIDGYVFWSPNEAFTIQGALHFAQNIIQADDETFAQGTVLFTAQDQVSQFEDAPTNVIFVATLPGGSRYAFSSQQGFLAAAGQWHYFGRTIPPAALSQLLDEPGKIDLTRAVTSNSLAFWLQLNGYQTPYGDAWSNEIPIYPAKLVSANLQPPYVAVKIVTTEPLQLLECISPIRSSYQLCADTVRLTLYGLQSNEVHDFNNCITQYAALTGNFGFMTPRAIVDEQREIPELEAIAMKKTIDVKISYIQKRVDDVTRQLIEKATCTFILGTIGSTANLLGTQGGSPFETQGGQGISTQ